MKHRRFNDANWQHALQHARGDRTIEPKVWLTYRERQIYWKDQDKKREAARPQQVETR
jgi:hypothetical protein